MVNGSFVLLVFDHIWNKIPHPFTYSWSRNHVISIKRLSEFLRFSLSELLSLFLQRVYDCVLCDFGAKMDNLKMHLIRRYFAVNGVCHLTSFQPQNYATQKISRIGITFSILHLIIISVANFFAIFRSHTIFGLSGADSIGSFPTLLLWILPSITHYILIIESLRTVDIKYRFWARIQFIDALLDTREKSMQSTINEFILKCAILEVSTIGLHFYVLRRIHMLESWHNYVLVTIYTFYVGSSQILFFVLFTDTLSCRSKFIAKRIKEAEQGGKNNLRTIHCCRKAFGLLWQSVEDLNEAFGNYYKEESCLVLW